MTDTALADMALESRKNAYAPYSRFAVGAALLCADGRIFVGCNIENAAYNAGICAERAALSAAVSAGARAFSAIAVAGGAQGEACENWCPPCGICRQMLREFCLPDTFRVLFVRENPPNISGYTLAELLPQSFGPSHLDP